MKKNIIKFFNSIIFVSIYFIFIAMPINAATLKPWWHKYMSAGAKFVQSVQHDEYSETPATVRLSTTLSDQEKQFVADRLPQIRTCIETLLNTPLGSDAQVPTIAFCFSGGGYRAMIETAGSLIAADELGLLSATMYMSGLSGSTWAITPWVASGMSINDYFEQLIPKLTRTLTESYGRLTYDHKFDLAALMLRKHGDGQSIGIVDIYGAMLANNLLDGIVNDPFIYTLADLMQNLSNNQYPLPISTAVLGGKGNHHNWVEFTPFEIGCNNLGYIPTWALGRRFDGGKALPVEPDRFAYQQNLGYLMGIWGSAFTIDMGHIEFEIPEYKDRSLVQMLRDTFEYLGIKDENFGAAYLPNFSFGLFNQQQDISLIDGGLDLVGNCFLNIGIIPLLRKERNVDIIIICDASMNTKNAPALRAAELRAKSLGLKFPEINYENIDQCTVSVFEDSSKTDIPTIIYIPGIPNPNYGQFDPHAAAYTATTNFYYTPEQTRELAGLARQNLLDSQHVIIDAIHHSIEKKHASWFNF
jgi:phospholipase A2